MHRRIAIIGLLTLFVGTLSASAEDNAAKEKAAAGVPAVTPIADIKVKDAAFGASGPQKPLVLKSRDDAAAYFDKDELEKLDKQVDFKKQVLLVFAWQGSGQDQLDVAVGESFPEVLMFSYKRGRTKDLRTHVKIFAARENVRFNLGDVEKR